MDGGEGPIYMDSTDAHANPRSPTAPTEHHGADGIHGILTGYFFFTESWNFQNLTVGGWGGGGESGRMERGEGPDAHAIPRSPTEAHGADGIHGILTEISRNIAFFFTEFSEFDGIHGIHGIPTGAQRNLNLEVCSEDSLNVPDCVRDPMGV